MIFDLTEFLKFLWTDYGHGFCLSYNYVHTIELPDHHMAAFEHYIRINLDCLDMIAHLCEYLAENES